MPLPGKAFPPVAVVSTRCTSPSSVDEEEVVESSHSIPLLRDQAAAASLRSAEEENRDIDLIAIDFSFNKLNEEFSLQVVAALTRLLACFRRGRGETERKNKRVFVGKRDSCLARAQQKGKGESEGDRVLFFACSLSPCFDLAHYLFLFSLSSERKKRASSLSLSSCLLHLLFRPLFLSLDAIPLIDTREEKKRKKKNYKLENGFFNFW